MVLIGLSGHLCGKIKKASLKTWTISKHSSKWTLSGTICVDGAGNESCDLVEITRVKFIEVQGAPDRPHAIQYLTVHCEILPLVLSSGSKEATKVPVRCFLQIATTSWNSMWERWLPDFQWYPVQGGLCGNEEFEKQWPRYVMTRLSSMD